MRRLVIFAHLGLILLAGAALSAGCRFSPHLEDGVVACGGDAGDCPSGLQCVPRSSGLSVCCRDQTCAGIDLEREAGTGEVVDAPLEAPSPDGPADAPPAPDTSDDLRLPAPDAPLEVAPDAMAPPACEQRACSGAMSDRCCPTACGPIRDVDCPGCGNGRVEAPLGETCDPPESCPTTCPELPCARQQLVGGPGACNVRCLPERITACTAGDSCCPSTCNAANDAECSAVCDNGAQEAGETCEPQVECARREGACSSDANVIRTRSGEVARCTFVCSEMPRPCLTGDGFCPAGCTPSTDNDCAGCGNGRVEGAETCDPPVACLELQSRCVSDAAIVRTGLGDSATCSYRCQEQPRGCASGDGFCPAGCSAGNDGDCAGCGNGRLEPGETCDPPTMCLGQQAACVGDAATVRTGSGDPGACTFRFLEMPRACLTGDGFCPAGCVRATDRDCKAPPGETCTGNGDCLSGMCEDQRCCQRRCEACQSCTGAGGTCLAITNMPDPGDCDRNRTCDATGRCVNTGQ